MTDTPERDIFLSIIINNYNYAQFVGEAIESAIAVADEACEIIVVDDGSTDESLEVIRGSDNLIVVEKENGGQASALNAGFAASRGRYVHFLDADDRLVPGALETLRKTMPGKHMVHFASTVLDQELGLVSYYNSGAIKPLRHLWADYFSKGSSWLYPMSCNVFSRELLSLIMPLPEEQWRGCADTVLLALGSLASAYDASPETINEYRLHGENLYFSDNLSLLEGHIYEDRYHFKNSVHFRNFYVAGCDALMRIEDTRSIAAVLGNWVAYGENIRDYAELTKTHRKDIEDALDALIASQSVGFWQQSIDALRSESIDPAHLAAFHELPVTDIADTSVDPEPACQLCFNQWLEIDRLEPHLQGGFVVWHHSYNRPAYSLSQACRFSSRMNALSGFIRATFEVASETMGGSFRLVNQDGRIAELVTYEDNTRLADIPCDWVIDGELIFHFVFEKVQIPQTAGFSSSDLSMTGGYLLGAKFEAPVAAHFYLPLRAGETQPAARYLSPIRHLKAGGEEESAESGEVVLSQRPSSFSFSLPYHSDGHEWLEFEIANTSSQLIAVKAATQYGKPRKKMDVQEILQVPAGETVKFAVPIGFYTFSDAVPEVNLSCLTATPEDGELKVKTLRLTVQPDNHLFLAPGNAMSFHYGSMASAAVNSAWETNEDGLIPANNQPIEDDPASLTLHLHGPVPDELELTFKRPGEQLPMSSVLQPSVTLGIGVNGETIVCALSPDGKCTIPTRGCSELVISGWWTENPRKPYVLSHIETKASSGGPA